MARMLFDPPNFLVLDEPTNHLDLATKEMLVDSLKDFEGTMIFVSHDRTFLRGLSNRVLELGGETGIDAQPHAYPGTYIEYVDRTGHEAPGDPFLTMPVACLFDIHGNLPALEAVLDEVSQSEADHVVVGGDVLPGPFPCECLDRLYALDLPVEFIIGNGDRETLTAMREGVSSAVPAYFHDAMRWNASQLTEEHAKKIAQWPLTRRLHVGGIGDVLFCHATPRNDSEIILRTTADATLLPMFEPLGSARGGVRPYAHAAPAHGGNDAHHQRRQHRGVVPGRRRLLGADGTDGAAAADVLRRRESGGARARHRVSAEGRVRVDERPAAANRRGDVKAVRRCGAEMSS